MSRGELIYLYSLNVKRKIKEKNRELADEKKQVTELKILS